MAPEVMEGSPYNGKVDVYSYGVVLCELFSRHLPFSDRYRAFEFIEAVLEQGETPTIPRWCHSAPKNTTTTTSATTTSATSHTHTAWQDEEDEVGALALPPAIQTLRRGTLHRVIMQCLDRDSKRRPSFDALVKVILLLLLLLNAMLILLLLLLLHVMLILLLQLLLLLLLLLLLHVMLILCYYYYYM